jgi:dihydroflavonol-4-reductase
MMVSDLKIGIVGANGFLGRALVQRLGMKNDVVAICRRDIDLAVPLRKADLMDVASLEAAFEGLDVVVNAAGNVSNEPEDAEWMWQVHCQGAENVVAAAKAAGVGKMVHMSSSGTVAVSEESDLRMDEFSPRPLNLIQKWPYYRSKLIAEDLMFAAEGIDVYCLNPALLLGPGDLKGGSTKSVRYFLEDRLDAAPSGSLAFVDVRDVAEAVLLVLAKGEPRRRYLLGATNLRFSEFYERLARISGKSNLTFTMPGFTRQMLNLFPKFGKERGIGLSYKLSRVEVEVSSHNWCLDASRAKNELGWEPRDPMETLTDTVIDLVHNAADRA